MNTTKIFDWISDWWKSVFPDLSSVSDWSISHKDVKLDYINVYDVRQWIIFFFFILLLLLLYFIFRKQDRTYRRMVSRVISKALLPSALAVWLAGVVIYIIGFYNTSVAGISVVLRAIVASFRMFVVANELARVPAFLQNDSLYMLLFALVHFAAALISFLFIFRMISYKIKSSFDLLLHRIFHSKKKIVHVFWGMNEASFLLAESIYESFKKETIIFIDIDKDSEDDTKKKSNLNRILGTITITDNEIVRLGKINAYVAHCYDGPEGLKKADRISVFRMLRLGNIGAIVRKSSESHFYFLSDDEMSNIASALVFQKDVCLCRPTLRDKITLHIHARKGANNEVFDHYSQYNRNEAKLKMKVADSAYLSVMTLKEDERAHPVNCVDYDTETGLVNSKFTAMVIGFGGTGQEAFKFLYEYATFIGPDHKRVPFKCYAVDEKMDKIEGVFRAKIPNDIISDEEISLVKASVDSTIFWEKVQMMINDLNYIVITLNNDEIGLTLAVNLFKYALQHRDSNKKMLKIALRSYSSSYRDRMNEVCYIMNKSNAGANVELNIFGSAKDIYTCAIIRQEKILNDAKQFHWAYNNYQGDPETQWNDCFGQKKISQIIDRGCSCYHAIFEVNRMIGQNISNSLHCRTKLILMGIENDNMTERLKLYYGYVNSRTPETIKYNKCGAADDELLRNMAMLEHERWMAAHRLMGFRYAADNDSVKRLNNCMKELEKLDEKHQSYDYNVVDTTIKLAYKKLLEKK